MVSVREQIPRDMYSTQGRDESSSSSTAGLHCTILHSTIYGCAVCLYVTMNMSISYGIEMASFC